MTIEDDSSNKAYVPIRDDMSPVSGADVQLINGIRVMKIPPYSFQPLNPARPANQAKIKSIVFNIDNDVSQGSHSLHIYDIKFIKD